MKFESIGCAVGTWESDPDVQNFIAYVRTHIGPDVHVENIDLARRFYRGDTPADVVEKLSG